MHYWQYLLSVFAITNPTFGRDPRQKVTVTVTVKNPSSYQGPFLMLKILSDWIASLQRDPASMSAAKQYASPGEKEFTNLKILFFNNM